MAIPQSASILHHLRQTVLRHDGAGLSDGQLLRSFLYQGDEAAFEALVRRHGPMVRGVCRRILRNFDDADDAFQAAFLVLLRKASTLSGREVLGDWLHGVAYRTSLKARAAAARRRLKEKQAPRHEALFDNENRSDWLALLDDEIGRLPSKYRLPVVLCDLEGRTRKEAARQRGWPEGTVSGRLSRARTMLARRLTRRGVTLSTVMLVAGMASEATARLPFALVGPIYKFAKDFGAGSTVGSAPAHVVALTEGVVKAMFLSKLKYLAAIISVVLVLSVGIGAWRYAAVAGPPEKESKEEPVPVPEQDRAAVSRILPKDRRFRVDLRMEREKEGQHKLLATPMLLISEPQEAFFGLPEGPSIPEGASKMDFANMGPSVRVVVRADSKDKIWLDMTVNQPTRGVFAQGDTTVETKSIRVIRRLAFGEPTTVKLQKGDKGSSVLEVTAAVQVVEKDAAPNSIVKAEKDLQFAEFWRRTGHPESACFYFELIRRRYPDTIYAERAEKRLAELKKQLDKHKESKATQPARIGQIFIIGNKKISDEVILEQVKFYPGQILSYPDLRAAEQNLSRLKGLKSKPQVMIIKGEGEGEFRDIRIVVEEE